MPFTEVSPNQWVQVVTTSEDTVFQNRSGRVMFVTTLSTVGLPITEGYALGPDQGIVINSGKTVSVAIKDSNGQVFFVGV